MNLSSVKKIRSTYKMLLILMIISLLCTGCSDVGLESGFKYSSIGGSGDEEYPFYCGYKSDRIKFDIDDVMINLYYGHSYVNSEYMSMNASSIPVFDIYVSFGDDDNKYLVKHVEENLISEKYYCEVNYKKCLIWRTVEVIFNHHEQIKIPQEVFVKESGRVSILIYGTDIKADRYPKEQIITGTVFYYKLVDGKVVLSSQGFK